MASPHLLQSLSVSSFHLPSSTSFLFISLRVLVFHFAFCTPVICSNRLSPSSLRCFIVLIYDLIARIIAVLVAATRLVVLTCIPSSLPEHLSFSLLHMAQGSRCTGCHSSKSRVSSRCFSQDLLSPHQNSYFDWVAFV